LAGNWWRSRSQRAGPPSVSARVMVAVYQPPITKDILVSFMA
jgi:hypothetical protein